MKNHNQLLYKMVLTAIFSALCFVGVYIKIQLPVGMIHLGNFICIMASLLCGGMIGGISGALGMGISDIIYYGGFSVGVLRTLILKFGMGVIVGVAFRLFYKRKWNPRILNSICMVVFLVLFGLSIFGCAVGGMDMMGKHINIHFTIPIFLGLVTLLFVLVLIFDHKLNTISKIALSATSFGIIFNIFGEIYIKALLYYWIDSKYTSFDGAYAYAISGIPSLAITSAITCLLSAFIFYPLFNATKNYMNFNLINEEE
ncbi:MAG: ECF transporter S component [Anaeroplasmataceae bacterium]|nr:ECF transporter S component [Anaeroplasmataceae bacterium]